MDPNSYYEVQPSGLGTTAGLGASDLGVDSNALVTLIKAGSRAFLPALFPGAVDSPGLDPKGFELKGASLPVVIKFPSDFTAQDRYNWYQKYNFANINGAAQGQFKTDIENAYRQLGWSTDYGRKWEMGSGKNEIPVIDAMTLKIATTEEVQDDRGRIVQKAIPETIKRGESVNWGATLAQGDPQEWPVGAMIKKELPKMFGKSPSTSDMGSRYVSDDKDQQIPALVDLTQHMPYGPNLGSLVLPFGKKATPSISAAPADMPPTPLGGMSPATFAEGTEMITERPSQVFSDALQNPYTQRIETELGLPQYQSQQAYMDQNRDLVKQFLMSSAEEGGYNLKGIDDGTIDFDFEMDENGRLITLDVYRVKDGVRDSKPYLQNITSEGTADTVNEKFTTFKQFALTQDPTKPADGLPSGTFSATGAWAVPGFPQTKVPTTFGATGAAGMPTPGIITGSEQQQLLARMYPSEYAAALPASLQGGASSAIRDLYSTPISMAQRGYNLATMTGAFQPQQIAGGLGGFGFQQYLGSQPNYIQDLQRGIQAIDQVRQKYLAQGQSTQGFSLPELSIFENYIDKPEEELKLRQSLSALLPYQMRTAYSRNLQNMYDRARLQNPSSIARRQFDFNMGFNPLGSISPMQMQAPTPQRPTAEIPIGQSVNMDTSTDNTAVTGTGVTKTTASDGSTITFTPSGDGVTSTATVSQTEPKSLGGTRRELYGDGYAMVQRDNNGNIIQVYQIEADGSKKIIRDIKTDVAGADAQKTASDLEAKLAKEPKSSFTGDPGKRFPTGAPPTEVPKVFGDVSKYTKTPSPAPAKTPMYQGQKNLPANYMDFITGGRSGTTPTSTMENIGAADMPQGLGVSAMEGIGLGSPTMKVASPMVAPPGVVGSRVSDVGSIGALVKSPYANQFTGPTQMIPENIPMPPPPRVDKTALELDAMRRKALEDMTRMPVGAYKGSPYIIGGVSNPNALAIQAQLAKEKLRQDFETGNLNFPMKKPFELQGIGIVPEWYAPQNNRILMR